MPRTNTRTNRRNNRESLIGELSHLLARSPLTDQEIADMAGVTVMTIWNWRNERVGSPNPIKAASVLSVLGYRLSIHKD